MISIGLFNTKGGVGKSALTVMLADFFSSLFKLRILVVDLDPNGSATQALFPSDEILKAFNESRCLTTALHLACSGNVSKSAVINCLLNRINEKESKEGAIPLGDISLLTTHSSNFHMFMNSINHRSDFEFSKVSGNLNILKDCLATLHDQFDIAFIDFPPGDIHFWTTMGLRATERWLLPVIPDNLSIAPIESSIRAVADSNYEAILLGTVLNKCPKNKTDTYQKAKASLEGLQRCHAIPELFDYKSEVLNLPEMVKATDWGSEKSKTLNARYCACLSAKFPQGLYELAKEINNRLIPGRINHRIRQTSCIQTKLRCNWRN